MKIKVLILLAGLSLAYLPSQAEVVKSATTIDFSCRQDRQDKGDLGWRLSKASQKYANQCLNTKSVRPIKKVSETSQELVFQNFYHKGRYWVAKWTKSDSVKVRYLGVHFDVGIPLVKPAHTELRFQFRRGLELTPQVPEEGLSSVVVKDVIISWEAVFPKGVSYDFMTGINPNYALAGRFVSLEARFGENFIPGQKPRQIDQYTLSLNDQEATALFQFSLDRSHKMGLQSSYLTLANNCTDLLFATIDQVLVQVRKDTVTTQWPFRTELSPNPILAPAHRALVARRLIQWNQQEIDLATEMGLR
jgi:hypothetical protein